MLKASLNSYHKNYKLEKVFKNQFITKKFNTKKWFHLDLILAKHSEDIGSCSLSSLLGSLFIRFSASHFLKTILLMKESKFLKIRGSEIRTGLMYVRKSKYLTKSGTGKILMWQMYKYVTSHSAGKFQLAWFFKSHFFKYGIQLRKILSRVYKVLVLN